MKIAVMKFYQLILVVFFSLSASFWYSNHIWYRNIFLICFIALLLIQIIHQWLKNT